MSTLMRHSSRQRKTRNDLSAVGLTSYTTRPRNRHRYCGKEKDSESGLYYYGARYYESWTCRFVSVDPLAEKYAQLSSYNYADNSPVTDLDVDGLQSTRSQQSPQSNAAQDNTSTQSPVKPKIVPAVTLPEPPEPPKRVNKDTSKEHISANSNFSFVDRSTSSYSIAVGDSIYIREIKNSDTSYAKLKGIPGVIPDSSKIPSNPNLRRIFHGK